MNKKEFSSGTETFAEENFENDRMELELKLREKIGEDKAIQFSYYVQDLAIKSQAIVDEILLNPLIKEKYDYNGHSLDLKPELGWGGSTLSNGEDVFKIINTNLSSIDSDKDIPGIKKWLMDTTLAIAQMRLELLKEKGDVGFVDFKKIDTENENLSDIQESLKREYDKNFSVKDATIEPDSSTDEEDSSDSGYIN